MENKIFALEASIADYLANGGEELRNKAFAAYVDFTGVICDVPFSSGRISDFLQDIIKSQKGRRDAAIITVRVLAVDGLLPLQEDAALSRVIVALVEAAFPDGAKHLKLSEKRQTFEKIEALRGFHSSICHGLVVLSQLPQILAEINNMKSEVQKAIRREIVSAYLHPFGFAPLKSKIIHICEQVSELVACGDSSYKSLFDQLQNSCDEATALASNVVFFNKEFFGPFLSSLALALQALENGSSAQFACSIETRRKKPYVAEKRYPLHEVNKVIVVTVPMVNTGPGMATDVIVNLRAESPESISFDAEELHLGDIPPGEFAVSFKVVVLESSKNAGVAICVEWGQLFGESQRIVFDACIEAQDSSVDWVLFEQLDPFSLEVAESAQFVGRAGKIQAIGNRLLRTQMSSTYITGQKRVGKTSLAKAVLRYVADKASPHVSYESAYLEWGEYSTADARGTVMALGQMLYAFLRCYLPRDVVLPEPDFNGSLAPLNIIAKALESKCPGKRFIIVLDEFDEIHPEMYRFGALAEVFFANLRTLAARKNLAFILVGGEKMPFIIGAQGDQLNKFVREPLDSFSRSDDWSDFVELVTAPVKGCLSFEESALNLIFTLTNGHPYYTKLLCARIFSNAVSQRDTDIISRDVKYAFNGRVSDLDTNAFAHFWKDGINAEREEAEVIELKRLRVLVAFGRASRKGITTKETVVDQLSSAILQSQEVSPLIDDFCRRDIMREVSGEVFIQLPIFYRWLQEIGVSKLISSTLADDLEVEIRKANDKAYVTSMEIEGLVKNWPLYRGGQITGEAVRAWLEQVKQPLEQRLLFTLLVRLHFVTIPQINEGLRYAHDRVVAKVTPPMVRESKTERRRDLLVTYLDGPGKSGASYAKAYAKENGLLMECVVDPVKVIRRISGDAENPKAVIVVDDLAGTGKTVVESLDQMWGEVSPLLIAKDIPFVIVLLFSTEEAQLKIEGWIKGVSGAKIHLYVNQLLGDEHRAFPKDGYGFWSDEQTRDRAKALCMRLGSGLYKEPLGYGSQSLLIAFPDTCPNNNLPIIFAAKSGKEPWNALLLRPAS